MADTIHSGVVGRVCELIGAEQLAAKLDVSPASIQAWLAGSSIPPPRSFRKMLSILKNADPAYWRTLTTK